jgi:hypothetical protein
MSFVLTMSIALGIAAARRAAATRNRSKNAEDLAS